MLQYSEIERGLEGLILSSDIGIERKILRGIEESISKLDRDTLLSLGLSKARHVVRFPEGMLRQIQDDARRVFQQYISEVYGSDWQNSAALEESLTDLYLGFIQNLMRSRLNTLQMVPYLEHAQV